MELRSASVSLHSWRNGWLAGLGRNLWLELSEVVRETLFDRAAAEPHEMALLDDAGARGWGEAAEHTVRVAHALRALDLGPDDRLAILGENCSTTVIMYAAAALAGVSTIFVNHHLSEGEVAYMLADGGAEALWATDRYSELAERACQGLRCRLLRDGSDGSWAELVAGADSTPLPGGLPAARDLIYTSGTTGRPKGVEFPRHLPATVAERVQVMAAPHLSGLGTHLVAGPLYHAGPHSAVGLFLAGGTVLVPGSFDAAAVLDAIERYSVASTVMVPTHFVRLLALPADLRDAADVSSLRVVAQTGSSCPLHVKRAMIDWFGPVIREAYGGSESGILSHIESDEWLRKPGSVGRVDPGFDVVVLDDNGKKCPVGEDGRLFFVDETGRGVSYFNDAEKTAAAHIAPGVFTLGDVGHVDEEGYLYVTGRTSDMVISGGVNIYPAECERVLIGHPAVTAAAVFGVPDDEMGERLAGVACTDRDVEEADLTEYCRQRIAHYKVPRHIHVVQAIPHNAMGKVDKQLLRDRFLTSGLT